MEIHYGFLLLDIAILNLLWYCVLLTGGEAHELIERLEKPERKLVLQIIDCKDQIAEDLSIDSFIAGFRLAMRLSQELNIYEKEHPLSTSDFVE